MLALTGGVSHPGQRRVFLLSLAVVDDLLAIVLIAVLFTSSIALLWLLGAPCAWPSTRSPSTGASPPPLLYVPLALLTWFCMHDAGIHATLAGVALGLLTRVRRDPPGEREFPRAPPRAPHPPLSAGVCVPLFALFASGVALSSELLGQLFTNPISQSVIAGLLVGKTVGIFGISWLAIRLGIAKKPRALGFRDMFALSVLGAIGFTVSFS